MERFEGFRVRRSILNLFDRDDLDELIKEMIQFDLSIFEMKYKEQIENLNKTKFQKKGQTIDEILHILKRDFGTTGEPLSNYTHLFEQELLPLGEKYLQHFQNRFLLNLDFHFNMKRVYGISNSDSNVTKKLNELYKIAVESFTNERATDYLNKYLPRVSTINNEYVHIEKKQNKLEIIEKIGVVHLNNIKKMKTVFVKYVFDLKHNYFEIAYNEHSVKDICTLQNEDRSITLVSSDEVPIENKFQQDSLLLGELYKRIKRTFFKDIELVPLGSELMASEFFSYVIKEKEEIQPQIDIIDQILHSKGFSPYEAVLYYYFKADKEHIIDSVLKESSSENKDIEMLVKNNFPELDTNDLASSVRFLRNMTVFSRIKQKTDLLERLDNFLFMFTVRDLAVTKSTTKNEERWPVYTSDFYWHLQEVIDSIKFLNEIGIRISLEISDGTKVFQEVKILTNEEFLTFTYYQNSRRRSLRKNPKNKFKLAEGRNIIHEHIKDKFNEIISTEPQSGKILSIR